MITTVSVMLGAGMLLVLTKARREYLKLPELLVSPGAEFGDVSVIIPTRDEAKNVGAAVAMFGGKVPVIVVDDGSKDKTVEIASAAGATVIPAPPLRKGDAGKANACAAGAKASKSHWILFVDADVRVQEDFLPSLMSEARKHSFDMIGVMLKQKNASVWEALIVPYATALSFAGVNAGKVNSKKSYDALSSSYCTLFRREVYDFMGGHNAVSTSIIEDAMLAYIAKRHRINQQVMRAEQLGTVTRTEGLNGAWRWLARASFRFVLVSRWCAIQVLIAALLLTSYIPVIAALVWKQHPAAAALVAITPPILLRGWYGSIFKSIWAPLAIYAFDVISILALIGTAIGRGTQWKGRNV